MEGRFFVIFAILVIISGIYLSLKDGDYVMIFVIIGFLGMIVWAIRAANKS